MGVVVGVVVGVTVVVGLSRMSQRQSSCLRKMVYCSATILSTL
ncbi:MAG: DUF2613 family protein [Promethearchaeota archaeon]